ncbi:hypothetical protein ACNKHM_05890 [Shigella sonnei]
MQTEVVISGAGISADRTALTLDGQSRIQMLANGNEQKPLVLSLRDAEGQPVTGMKDQIKTELTFKPAGNIVTRTLKATESRQSQRWVSSPKLKQGCISLSFLPERSQVRQRLLLALMT